MWDCQINESASTTTVPKAPVQNTETGSGGALKELRMPSLFITLHSRCDLLADHVFRFVCTNQLCTLIDSSSLH